MKNKELVDRKLDEVQAGLKKLRFIVQRNEPIESYNQPLDKLQEQIEDIQSYVRREGMEPQEGFGMY